MTVRGQGIVELVNFSGVDSVVSHSKNLKIVSSNYITYNVSRHKYSVFNTSIMNQTKHICRIIYTKMLHKLNIG